MNTIISYKKQWEFIFSNAKDIQYKKVIQFLKNSFHGSSLYENIETIVKDLVTKYKNDETIYIKLRDLYIKEVNTNIKPRENRLVDLLFKLDHSNKCFKTEYFILDYGCGPGSLTIELSKRLESKRIYACDVIKPKIADDINFELIYDGQILPYKNHTFDTIICMMVLHHVKDIKNALKELYRILKPGGYIIIREHDFLDNMQVYLDIVHGMYNFVLNDVIEDEKFCSNYYAKYRSDKEWRKLLDEYKFKHLLKTQSDDPIKGNYINNPQRQYFMILTK